MAGDATIEELAGLEELMLHSEEWKILAEQLMTNLPRGTKQDEQEADAAFVTHTVKMQLTGRLPEKIVSIRGKRNWLNRAMRIAAILVIVVATISTFKWLGKKNNTPSPIIEKPAKATIITQNGSRTRSLLADGTTTWLNVGSKLVL